jgi:D-glycerate 3-kinase
MDEIREFIDQLRSCGALEIVVAVQGVQGAGKTFLCAKLAAEYNGEHISLDDFYLPDDELRILHASTRDDAYRVRGNPGSHDTRTLLRTIQNFKNRTECTVPVYDKYAHEGRGDRVGWRALSTHADILFVEGWCLGFASQGIDSHVDRALRDEYEPLYKHMDGMVILRCESVQQVYTLRLRAERAAIAAGQTGMSDEETRRFVDVYIPTYETYLAHFYLNCPVEERLFIQYFI